MQTLGTYTNSSESRSASSLHTGAVRTERTRDRSYGVIMSAVEDPSLPPRYLVEHFRKVYEKAHQREPMVRYMGNHWYYVNGETVHRTTLIEEIQRLQHLIQRQNIVKTDQNLLKRLIAKLKSL